MVEGVGGKEAGKGKSAIKLGPFDIFSIRSHKRRKSVQKNARFMLIFFVITIPFYVSYQIVACRREDRG